MLKHHIKSEENRCDARKSTNPTLARQAQLLLTSTSRTHRERKEAYVKSLETEVVQLRANEARLFRETKSLYAELRAVKALLVTSGIPIPPAPPESLTSDETTQERDDAFEFSISSGASDSSKGTPQQARINVRRQARRKGVAPANWSAQEENQVPNCSLSSTLIIVNHLTVQSPEPIPAHRRRVPRRTAPVSSSSVNQTRPLLAWISSYRK